MIRRHRGRDDLVIGEDERYPVRAGNLAARDTTLRAIRPDDQPGDDLALFAACLVAIDDPRPTAAAVDPEKCPGEPLGPGATARSRSQGSKSLRSTMPTNPFSTGISTWR